MALLRRRLLALAHYGVHVETRRTDGTLLRLGPYSQTWLVSRDADRLNTELDGRAAKPSYQRISSVRTDSSASAGGSVGTLAEIDMRLLQNH